MKTNKRNAVGIPREDKIMYGIIYAVMSLLLVIILYPLIYILSNSFSSGQAVTAGRVLLWPVDFSVMGYEIIFDYKQESACDYYYLRVELTDGRFGWTSPIWVEDKP